MLRSYLTDDQAARLRAVMALADGQRGSCDLSQARAAVTGFSALRRLHPEDAEDLAASAWADLKADHLARVKGKRPALPHGPRDAA